MYFDNDQMWKTKLTSCTGSSFRQTPSVADVIYGSRSDCNKSSQSHLIHKTWNYSGTWRMHNPNWMEWGACRMMQGAAAAEKSLPSCAVNIDCNSNPPCRCKHQHISDEKSHKWWWWWWSRPSQWVCPAALICVQRENQIMICRPQRPVPPHPAHPKRHKAEFRQQEGRVRWTGQDRADLRQQNLWILRRRRRWL